MCGGEGIMLNENSPSRLTLILTTVMAISAAVMAISACVGAYFSYKGLTKVDQPIYEIEEKCYYESNDTAGKTALTQKLSTGEYTLLDLYIMDRVRERGTKAPTGDKYVFFLGKLTAPSKSVINHHSIYIVLRKLFQTILRTLF